jgi:endonuclease YncB( thermonuclease family)
MYNKVFVCNLSINFVSLLLLLVFSSLSIVSLSIGPHEAFAKCPNGYHKSPDGDCEKVTGSSSSSSSDTSNSDNHIGLESSDESGSSSSSNNNIDNNYANNNTNVLPSTECQGEADCFKGKVTDVIDGDTLDINNIRVRLTLVNTPETGESGYTEAKEFVKLVCRIRTNALVDEDDGQKEGSYDRLIGLVYCAGNYDSNSEKRVLLNELLLQRGYAVVFEEFCHKSEFSNAAWVQKYGC